LAFAAGNQLAPPVRQCRPETHYRQYPNERVIIGPYEQACRSSSYKMITTLHNMPELRGCSLHRHDPAEVVLDFLARCPVIKPME